jgi:hypothetical protein
LHIFFCVHYLQSSSIKRIIFVFDKKGHYFNKII